MSTTSAELDLSPGAVSPGRLSSEPSASTVLDAIDRTKAGGASLSFSRRNVGETISLHAGLVTFSALIGYLWHVAEKEPIPAQLWLVWAVGAVVAMAASWLAVRAYREHHTYARTDRWDGLLGMAQVVVVALATIWTGGVTSAEWLPVVVGSAYLGTVLVYTSGWAMAALLAVLPAVSQWIAVGELPSVGSQTFTLVVALSIGLPAAFLIVRGVSRTLYDTAEGTGWDQALLVDQVRQLSVALEAASQGDLTARVEVSHLDEGTDFGFERSQYILALSRFPGSHVGVVAGFGVSGAGRVGSRLGRRRLRCWWRLVSRRLLRRSSRRRWRRRRRRLRSWRRRRRRSRRRLSRWRRLRRRRWGLLSRVGRRCRRRWRRWIRLRLGWIDCVSGVGVGGEGSGDRSDFAGD